MVKYIKQEKELLAMDEKKDFQQMMERIDRSNRRQARYGLFQCIFSLIAALCCVAVLLMFMSSLPQLQQMGEQAGTILSNLETISSELGSLDLSGMVSNVDSLVTESQSGLNEALSKINAIDIDALNSAIKDLASVIEPLAKLSKIFD